MKEQGVGYKTDLCSWWGQVLSYSDLSQQLHDNWCKEGWLTCTQWQFHLHSKPDISSAQKTSKRCGIFSCLFIDKICASLRDMSMCHCYSWKLSGFLTPLRNMKGEWQMGTVILARKFSASRMPWYETWKKEEMIISLVLVSKRHLKRVWDAVVFRLLSIWADTVFSLVDRSQVVLKRLKHIN